MRLTEIKLPLDHDEAALRSAILKRLGIASRGDINPRVEAARAFASVAGLPDRD